MEVRPDGLYRLFSLGFTRLFAGGLLTEGTGYQLAMQLLAFAVIAGWAAFWAIILFVILRAVDSLRISEAAERTMLLDIQQAGVSAMNPLNTPVHRYRPDVVVFEDESEPPARHTRNAHRDRRSRDTTRLSQSIERSLASSSDTPPSSHSASDEGAEPMEVFEPSHNYVMDRQLNNNNQSAGSVYNAAQPAPVVIEVPDSSDSSGATTPRANNNNNNVSDIADPEDDPIIDPMLLHQRMSLDNLQRSERSPQSSVRPSFEASDDEDSSSEANRNIAMIREGTTKYNTILHNKLNRKQNKS